MEKKIRSLNWQDVKKDVARFLKPRDQMTLTVWHEDFFIEQLKKLSGYL